MTTHRCEFEMHAVPVAWARARQQGRRFFTDEKVAAAKHALRRLARENGIEKAPRGTQVALECDFAFVRPESSDNAHHVVKPDLDNLVKLVMDALTGAAWDDDTQVTTIYTTKIYASAPYTRIAVTW